MSLPLLRLSESHVAMSLPFLPIPPSSRQFEKPEHNKLNKLVEVCFQTDSVRIVPVIDKLQNTIRKIAARFLFTNIRRLNFPLDEFNIQPANLRCQLNTESKQIVELLPLRMLGSLAGKQSQAVCRSSVNLV